MHGLANDLFLKNVMRRVLTRHKEKIATGRMIQKKRLYSSFSWWYRMSKPEARRALTLLAETYPGVRFSNRGLFVPKEYLSPTGGIESTPRPRRDDQAEAISRTTCLGHGDAIR